MRRYSAVLVIVAFAGRPTGVAKFEVGRAPSRLRGGRNEVRAQLAFGF